MPKNIDLTGDPESVKEQLRQLTPQERAAIKDEARCVLSRTDIVQYCKYVHEWDLEPHQIEWLKILQSSPKALIISPPEAGKSRVMRAFIEWTIGRNRDWAGLLIQNTSSQSSSQLGSIGSVLASDKYKKVFPDIQPTDRWSGEKLVVVRDTFRPDATLAGYGLRGPYQGAHVDAIIIDDPTDQTDVLSPNVMQLQKETVRGVLYDRLNKSGTDTKLFVVLTRWGDDDLVETFEKDLEIPVYTYPAYRDEPYSWGSKYLYKDYTEESIKELKRIKGPDLFKLTFLCSSSGAVRGKRIFGDKLDEEKHKVTIKKEEYEETKFVKGALGVDWGTSSVHQTVVVAAQKRADGVVIVRGAWSSSKGSSRELLDKAREFRNNYGIRAAWIDRSQSSLRDQFEWQLGMNAYKGESNVEYRISALLTLIDTGNILFDENGPGMTELWHQLTSYARDDSQRIIEKADDYVDACLYALCALYEPSKSGPGKNVEMSIAGPHSKNDQPMGDPYHDMGFNPAEWDDPKKSGTNPLAGYGKRL